MSRYCCGALPVFVLLLALSFCTEAVAVRKGEPSSDTSVVLMLRGDQPCGTGVLVSDKAVLTIRHVFSPTEASLYGFTLAQDGRQVGPAGSAVRGRFVEARASAEIKVLGTDDGLVLALIDPKDRPKVRGVSFPQLVETGDIPGSFENPKQVTLTGYGRTGREISGGSPTVLMRNSGTVALNGGPAGMKYFNTMSGASDQYARALDSGAPVFDGRVLLGITALIDGIADLPPSAPAQPRVFSIHVWLGDPTLHKWIKKVLAEW